MYKLFVGGLPFTVTDEELSKMFAEFGTVASAKVIINRDTNRSKGFGFVEFENDEEGKKAQSEMNGKELEGRNITVNEARPMQPRDNNRGGGGGGGGFGGRRNRY